MAAVLISDYISNILFLILRKYWQTALNSCIALLSSANNSRTQPPITTQLQKDTSKLSPGLEFTCSHYSFWKAILLSLLGRYNDAIQELNSLLNNPEVGLPSTIALISIHKVSNNPGNENLILNLESEFNAIKKKPYSETCYFSLILYHGVHNDINKAQSWIKTGFSHHPNSEWIEFAQAWINSVFVHANSIFEYGKLKSNHSSNHVYDSMDSFSQDSVASNQYSSTPFDSLCKRFPNDIGVATGQLLAMAALNDLPSINAAKTTLLALDPRNCTGILVGQLDMAIYESNWDLVSQITSSILGIDKRPTTSSTVRHQQKTTPKSIPPPGALGAASSPYTCSNAMLTIEAHLLQFIMAVLRDNYPSRITVSGNGLVTALRKEEGDNHVLVCKVLDMVSKVPKSAPIPASITREWLNLAEKFNSVKDPFVHCVIARIAMRSDLWPRAKKAYSAALTFDPQYLKALEGTPIVDLGILKQDHERQSINAHSNKSAWTELNHDIELLATFAPDSPATLYLQAEIAKSQTRDTSKQLYFLKRASETLILQANSVRSGLGMVTCIDLIMLENIIHALIDALPLITRCPVMEEVNILELSAGLLTQLYPGSLDARCMLAWSQYLSSHESKALDLARGIIDDSPGHWEAVQVLVYATLMNSITPVLPTSMYSPLEEKGKLSMTFLDAAMSINLELRRTSTFQILKAWSLRISGNVNEAREVLNKVNLESSPINGRDLLIYWSERIQTEKGDVKALSESAQLNVSAMYPNLVSDFQFILALADAQKKPDTSLMQLNQLISQDASLLYNCTIAISAIYLNLKNEPSANLRTWQHLVSKLGTKASKFAWIQLSIAYQKVDDIDRAIETLSAAASQYVDDETTELHRAIADVLIESHDYYRAIDYLLNAIEQASIRSRPPHVLALSKIYYKLKYFDQVEELVMKTIQEISSLGSAVSNKDYECELWEQLARSRSASNQQSSSLDAWKRAVATCQSPMLKSKMYIGLADELNQPNAPTQSNNPEIINCLENAAQLDPESATSRTKLAYFYLSQGKVGQAIELGKEIVNKWPLNNEGVGVLAQSLIQTTRFSEAIEYMLKSLKSTLDSDGQRHDDAIVLDTQEKKQPANTLNYELLANLIDVLYRTNRVDESKLFLDLNASDLGPPGLCYNRGLYYRFKGDIREAVRQFRRCFADSKWQVRATCRILEALLFPDLDAIDREVDPNVIEGAMPLIEKLPIGSKDRRVWECLARYGSRKREDIKSAIIELIGATKNEPVNPGSKPKNPEQNETSDLNNEESHIPTIVTLAIGHYLLGSVNRFKSTVKQLKIEQWSLQHAIWMEAGWMLLAQTYLENRKDQAANELVNTCMQLNPHGMRTRAQAMYAIVAERNEMYKEAANHWQLCYEYGGRTDCLVGTRLCLALIQIKKPTLVITIVHQLVSLLLSQQQEGSSSNNAADLLLESDPVVQVPICKNNNSKANDVGGGGQKAIRLKSDVLDVARKMLRP